MKSKGVVVLPYVQGLSETTSRIMKKYKVNTAMKPHNTIKRSLVRPKDKVEPRKMCEGVYSITGKNCNATYIGETKRTLGTSIKEHKEDAEKALADPTPEATEKHQKKRCINQRSQIT